MKVRIRTNEQILKSVIETQSEFFKLDHLTKVAKEIARPYEKLAGVVFTAEKNERGRWIIPGLPGVAGKTDYENLTSSILWDVVK